MDEKYIENLGGSTHIEEGLWNRMKSRASGYKRAAQNIMGKSTAPVEDIRFESLFKGFVKNSVKVLEYFEAIIDPYFNRKEKIPDSYMSQVENLKKLKLVLQQVEKTALFEAGPLIPPFSMLGAKASGQIDQVLNSTIQQLTKVYNKFETDARKLGIVPDQFLSRRMSAISPAATDALKQYGKLIGKNIVSTPPEDATTPSSTVPPPLPATPPEPPIPTPDAPIAPIAPVKPDPEQPALSPTPDADKGSPTDLSNTSETERDEVIYDLILQSINKITKILFSPRVQDEIKASIRRDASKNEVILDPDPIISHKIHNGIILWHLRFRYTQPDTNVEYQHEVILNDKPKKLHKWEILFTYRLDDVLKLDVTVNKDFDILEQIKKTNPKLKDVVERSIKISGKPSNIEEINNKLAEALGQIKLNQQPEPPRVKQKISRGEKLATADQTGRTTTPGQTPKVVDFEPETGETTSTGGVIPPDEQGRTRKDVGREDPEPSDGDEKPIINKDLSITYKGKTYRWNQAKPISRIKKALGDEEWDNYVNTVEKKLSLIKKKQKKLSLIKKKQKKLSESAGFSYRDFFPL